MFPWEKRILLVRSFPPTIISADARLFKVDIQINVRLLFDIGRMALGFYQPGIKIFDGLMMGAKTEGRKTAYQ